MMTAPHQPYAFDGPYAGCYANRAMCMDERHVYTIFDVLMCWPFVSTLELGCFDGASSSAFIESANRWHQIRSVHLCDVSPSASLRSVVSACKDASSVVIQRCASWDLLASPIDFDFVLVDANHDLASVTRELEHILRRQPLCVMAHDTNATRMGYPHAEGAQHLADTLRRHPSYRGRCIEDAVVRDGEETHRGLFLATTSDELFERAREVFRARCPIITPPCAAVDGSSPGAILAAASPA